MATPTRASTVDRIRERLAFEHDHDRATKAIVFGFAVVLAVYLSWLLADLHLRTPAFVLGLLGAAYALYARPTRTGVVLRGLRGFALLVFLTPVALNVTFLLAPSGTGQIGNVVPFVLTVVDLAYLVVFALLAAVPAFVAWVIDRRSEREPE